MSLEGEVRLSPPPGLESREASKMTGQHPYLHALTSKKTSVKWVSVERPVTCQLPLRRLADFTRVTSDVG
jgi:hypothetical protein